MAAFFSWYFLSLVIGIIVFPLSFRLLSNLPEKGISFARVLGLLGWNYIFWLLASTGIIQNDTGGVLLALSLVGVVSFLAGRGQWKEILAWLDKNKRAILTGELLFLVAFGFAAWLRAMGPDISGTEKPMELAFINAILRSPSFPPNDPWLSGYSISYYYFGYVMVANLVRLSGITSGVGFNLAIGLWFGLTALAAYGVVFNLTSIWAKQNNRKPLLRSLSFGLFGPLFILLVSNLEGLLELFYAQHLFWNNGKSDFWSWLAIKELDTPPVTPPGFWPNRPGLWFWRASRVVRDFDLAGVDREIIDEFPFFSYLLGDLHPHVLAAPFVLLAIGLGFNFFLQIKSVEGVKLDPLTWFIRWVQRSAGYSDLDLLARLGWQNTLLAALALGALSFLNTWDFPIYVGLFSAVYTFIRFRENGWGSVRIRDFIGCGLLFGVSGVAFYLPFYLGFSSQAGGLLPSLEFFTYGKFFWLMFGSLLLPVLIWLLWSWKRSDQPLHIKQAFLLAIGVGGGLWIFSYLYAGLLVAMLSLGSTLVGSGGGAGQLAGRLTELGGLFLSLHGDAQVGSLLGGSLLARLSDPVTFITLVGLLTLVWGLLGVWSGKVAGNELNKEENTDPIEPQPETFKHNTCRVDYSPTPFVLLLLLVALGLTLVPEFVYLRDQFGTRMNTIFKFYFQAWILFGLAAAYASGRLWEELKSFWRYVFGLVWVILLSAALIYPFYGVVLRTDPIKSLEDLNLDGTTYFERYNPADAKAIRWLKSAPDGVVAEAIGGSYSEYARVSTLTGLPTVLGWPGHESQWRGGSIEMGSREPDIQRLYRTGDWNEAVKVLEQYHIRYVFVGSLEKSGNFRTNENKFKQNLKQVYQQDGVSIYEYSPKTAGQ
jgi:YYY domain-containing protein